MKKYFLSINLLLLTTLISAQIDTSSTLYKTIKEKDSLLFNIGFNTCDISQFKKLVSDDFEFYHDKAGITNSKSDFVLGIENGLCKLNYKPKRVLDKKSLELYPLKQNGVLYGVIQNGTHRFYAIEKNKDEYQKEQEADQFEGNQFGINGTPGFVLGTQLISGAQPTNVFTQLIDAELSRLNK